MLTQGQYAKRIGIARPSITGMVSKGIIPLHKGKINPKEADAILKARATPSHDHARKNNLGISTTPKHKQAKRKTPAKKPPPEINGKDPEKVPFYVSRGVREYYQAQAAKIAYEEKTGSLVDRKKIEEQAFNLWRNYRDTWKNVPAKWAGEGAAQLGLDADTGQEKLFVFLDSLIDQTLEEFADGPGQSKRVRSSGKGRKPS